MPEVAEEPDAVLEDWAQLISFRPDVVLRPTSIAELEDLVERVHRGEPAHGRVRVPGSLHSCSRIVVSDALLDTSRLAKTIDFECGDAAVVASANVSLHEFLAALGARGKSVTATGGTDHQTLAGADLDRHRAGQLAPRALRIVGLGRARDGRPGDR